MNTIVPDISSTRKQKTFNYAVISPVKDEGDFIELTIKSMINQSIQPASWVIVDDGSRDKTASIAEKYTRKYCWIKLVKRPDRGIRKRGKGVIEAFYDGYKTLSQPYDFIAKLDGDVSFGPEYFESLYRRFADDPQLGIAGGGLFEKPDGKNWILNTTRDHVRGCTKVYRRQCFDAIGGLVASMGWDGIDEWKALAKGWKVESFLDLQIYHYRFTGAATGFLKSCMEQGDGAYRMGYHPLFLIARGIRQMIYRPYLVGGIAMIGAFFIAGIRKHELLADPAVIRYIRQSQMKMLTGLISGRPIHGP
jgi:biofilm PGA synthesis N-glycosyltransferase PgaC